MFRDGWAEGAVYTNGSVVSSNTGPPIVGVFPLACLGGGVPIVLSQRMAAARAAAAGSPPPVPPAYLNNNNSNMNMNMNGGGMSTYPPSHGMQRY